MNKKILLIGGGGHCKSVLDSLLESYKNYYNEIGIVDKEEKVGGFVMGIPVIGCDDDLPKLYKEGYYYAFITVGSIGNPSLRIKLFDYIKEIGFKTPNIIDSSAIISRYSKLDQGIFIGKQTIVNNGTTINKCSIVNSGSIVEHDCTIGEFVHVAPGSVLSGGVSIGDYSHIGSNSTIKQYTSIGSNSIVGMGSVVTKDIASNVMAYGNPCREVKKL